MSEEQAVYQVGKVSLETDYWVCECKTCNIHHSTSSVCLKCAAHAENCRKATLAEVLPFGLPVANVDFSILAVRRDSLLAAFTEEALTMEQAMSMIEELAEIEAALQYSGYVAIEEFPF